MSDTELDVVFRDYETLTARTDELFERVRAQFPAEVACTAGCSDCCHPLSSRRLLPANTSRL